MSDIKCPMCGKANPAEAEVCKYCQARLKPLAAPDTRSGVSPASNAGGDEADWLRSLAAKDPPPAAPATGPLPNPEDDDPDWLSRIRQKTQQEEGAVSPIGRPPKVEPGAADASTKPTGPLTPAQPAPSGGDDWLQSLRSANMAAEPPAAPSAPPPAPSSSPALEDLDNDEWLRSLNSRLGNTPGFTPPAPPAGQAQGAAEEQPAADEHLPLTPLSSQKDLIGKSQTPAADMPDWLKSFGAASQQPEKENAPATSEGKAAPAEIPDWLKSYAGEPPAAAVPVPPAAPAPAPAEPAAAAAEPSSDLSEWLKSFSAGQPAATGASQPEAETPAPEGQPEAAPADMPDWLKAFAAEQPVPPITPPQPAAAQAETAAPQAEPEAAPADMPDWLKAFAAEQPAVPPVTPPQPAAAQAETAAPEGQPEAALADMPDWLKAFAAPQPAAPGTEQPVPPAAAPQAKAEAAPSDVPEWLKDFAAPPAAAQETPAPEKPAAPLPRDTGALLGGINRHTGELILPASMAKNEDIPDWLKSYSQRESEPAAEPEPEGEPEPEQPEQTAHISPFSESNLPEWMLSDQAALPAPAESAVPAELPVEPGKVETSGPARPFAGQDVSQWLDASASEQAASDEAAAKARPEDLEMAPLPAWLQAMRPVESAAPPASDNVDDQRIEKSGPLAGLRGVLRSEDLVSQYQKPPAYSVKLRVSEPQTLRAGLLEKVIGEESKSQEVPGESLVAPQLLVRLATGLALVALILIVLLFGPKPLIPAALSQVDPQAIAINRMVDGLAPGAPVLVAVDYSGGLAGELRIVAQPVLQHLMSKNVRIIFLSTQIEGPALAESLFSSAQLSGASAYPAAFKANLGYLMGGSTALKALAASPLRSSLPVTWGGDGSWNQAALQGLSQITDFSQVILLTDTPENARDWVEQVQPELASKNVPLIVISSAQAAPMLRPYQQSGQITALLSGLTGGTAYEQIRQVRGDGTTSWNAYLAGILAMALFILMGGIVSLISNLSNSKPKRKV